MLISRIYPLLKFNNGGTKQILNQIRSSHHFSYRCGPPPPSPHLLRTAEIVQGFMWWWILWHLWTEPDHILGEFEYPDPSKWTDAELGIPSE